MGDTHFIETIDGRNVEINPTPENNYDIGGFGWALRVTGDSPQTTLFSVIIECGSQQDEATKQQVLELGRTIVNQMLATPAPKLKHQYCYNWEPLEGVIQIDCAQRPRVAPIE